MSSEETKKKAEAGSMEAQCSMALLYELGIDRKIDFNEAAKWWKLAANQGSIWAAKKLRQLADAKKISLTAEDVSKIAKAAPLKHPADLSEFSASPRKAVAKAPASGAKKILVVDDDPIILEVVSILLSRENFAVVTASDGQDALTRIAENPDISALIVDMKMPVMSGFEFLHFIRKKQILEGVPIIFLTSFAQYEYVEEAKRLHVNAWIIKPFLAEIFVKIVRKTLSEAPKKCA